MRLFHYALLPYLPELQFRGQLREVVAVMRSWRDKGKTNHLLINKVMEYPKSEFVRYFLIYDEIYRKRYGGSHKFEEEFRAFADVQVDDTNAEIFKGWHNKEYLRVCMANLYEKHMFGLGKSRITDKEWKRLRLGYYTITGEVYDL